jgi:hypothetical protein
MKVEFRDLSRGDKIAFALIVALFVGAMTALIGLENHYGSGRAHVPQPELGRIYPLYVHGLAGYLTQTEKLMLTGLWWLLSLAVLAFFLFIWRVRRRTGRNT